MKLRRLDDIIIHSIHETGQTALRWQDKLNTLYKGNINSVNEHAEEHFIHNIQECFPEDQILKDTTHHNNQDQEENYLIHLGKLNSVDRIWAIDPIDGVNNFSRKSKIWASCLALIENKEAFDKESSQGSSYKSVQASAIYQPPLDKLFICDDRKSGVYDLSSKKVNRIQDFQTSECVSLDKAIIGTYLKAGFGEDEQIQSSFIKLFNTCMTTRAFGSGSIDMAKVAIGRLDAWVMPNVNPWHWLPGAHIVEAAGGSIREVGVWKIAASTEELADEISEVIS